MDTTKKLECTQHAIGYIDLLGAKDKIANNQNYYLEKMHNVLLFIRIMQKDDPAFKILTSLKAKAFSDNIILAIEINENTSKYDALFGIKTACSFLQRMLISKCHWLSRGAITIGELYINNDIVWGTGLVRAYKLENEVAIFPRVILDPKMWDKINFSELSPTQKFRILHDARPDFDRLFYVDYTAMVENKPTDLQELLEDMRQTCNIQYSDNDKVAQKIAWVQTLISKKEELLNHAES